MNENRTQLSMPLYWRDPDIWREHRTPGGVHRPTEDQAFDNLYYSTRLIAGDYRIALTEWERRIDALDTQTRRQHWPLESRRYEYIAAALREPGVDGTYVRRSLDEIEMVRRHYALVESVIERNPEARVRIAQMTCTNEDLRELLKEVYADNSLDGAA